MDFTLPGLQPGFIRLEMEQDVDGWWRLRVAAAERRGLVTAADVDQYDDLAAYELQDVAGATLESLLGLL